MQGSYALVKEGKARERFCISMGKRLYKIGSSLDANAEDVTWMLFAAAEHLNSSLSLTDSDPLFLATMNLEIVVGCLWSRATSCPVPSRHIPSYLVTSAIDGQHTNIVGTQHEQNNIREGSDLSVHIN